MDFILPETFALVKISLHAILGGVFIFGLTISVLSYNNDIVILTLKNDIMLSLLMQGSSGLERRINEAFAVSTYLAEQIKARDGFHLLLEVGVVDSLASRLSLCTYSLCVRAALAYHGGGLANLAVECVFLECQFAL